jgi:hypothetical protein
MNTITMYQMTTRGMRDLAADVLDGRGRLRVMPASFWAETTREERAVFGVRHGLYSFPTVELVERLREIINGRSAIEIGAGHGVLAEALGIVATDSHQQTTPAYRVLYEAMGWPIVPYGPNVQRLEARAAVRTYRPQVVIGCWVTHKFDPGRPGAEGNEAGIDEDWIIDNCETYIVVGNDHVHRHKAIWSRPHSIERPPFVFSKAANGSPEFIAIWNRESVDRAVSDT